MITGEALHGGISARQSPVDLERRADAIVVGSASGVIQAGPLIAFTIRVSRLVKGDRTLVDTSVAVEAANDATNEIAVDASVNNFGLWFLKRSGNAAAWRLLPVLQGHGLFTDVFFPVAPGAIAAAYSYTPEAPVHDKLASELCAALENADGGAAIYPEMYRGFLDQLQSPVVEAFYRRMAASNIPSRRILGLGGLVGNGDSSALSSATKITGLDQHPTEASVLLHSIRYSFRATDANSVAVLGGIAIDTNLSAAFREAAAFALCSIHTMETLPYLAALLYAPEPALEAEGAGGLASFANGMPVQTMANVASLGYLQFPERAPYKTQETMAHFALREAALDYVAFWRTWWAEHKDAVRHPAH
jgi:hypothetical protein